MSVPSPLFCRLRGGLGNQMFQYACARALSVETARELVLDLDAFERPPPGDTPRAFALDALSIAGRRASTREMRINVVARKLARVHLPWPSRRVLRERPGLDLRRLAGERPGLPLLLDGYWQREACFSSQCRLVAADLEPRAALSAQGQHLHRRIGAAATSVAVHVRRGDYVTLPAAARVHGTPGPDYYAAAADRIRTRLKAQWFVFSDDIAWCREALGPLLPGACFVEPAPEAQAWEDLQLMAACRHHVIANSSFGWWGAWLGQQRRADAPGLVIAPRRWFRVDDPFDAERVPPSWMRL